MQYIMSEVVRDHRHFLFKTEAGLRCYRINNSVLKGITFRAIIDHI